MKTLASPTKSLKQLTYFPETTIKIFVLRNRVEKVDTNTTFTIARSEVHAKSEGDAWPAELSD